MPKVSSPLHRSLPTVLCLSLLIAGITFYHWRGIRPGYTFLPVDLANNNLPWLSGDAQPLQNWLISDPLYQFYPFLDFAVQSVRDEHEWPLWNPRILLGHPTAGDPLGQPFYPFLFLLAYVSGPARGLALGLWLQVVLAAVFTYGWLRALRCTHAASTAGALTYALSGYMVTWLETTFWLSTLCWLPAVLWMFEVALRKRSVGFAVLAAAALGLAILGGQFQFVLSFGVFLVLYALGRMLEHRARSEDHEASSRAGSDHDERSNGQGRWALTAGMTTLVLGAMVSAIFVLPAIELLNNSNRVVSAGFADSLQLRQLITLFVPNFYGNPTMGPYWGRGNFSEITIYAGIPGIVLACLAPFASRRYFTVYLALVALGFVYFIIGGPGVSLLGGIPGFTYMSLHRTSFILPLLIAALSATTLTTLGNGAASRRVVLGVAGALAMIVAALTYLNRGVFDKHQEFLAVEFIKLGCLFTVCLGLLLIAGVSRRPLTAWAFVALAFLDLYMFGSQFNPAGPIRELMPVTPAITFLQSRHPQRIVAFQRENHILFGPNIVSLFGLSEAGGYSSLVLPRYHQLVSAGDPRLDVTWMKRTGNMMAFSYPSTRLLDLFQVSHAVLPAQLDPSDDVATEHENDPCDDANRLGPEWRPVYQHEVTVLERASIMPRAYVVYAAKVIDDDAETVKRLLDPGFPLRRRAITAIPTGLAEDGGSCYTPATVVSYRNAQVTIQADAAQRGLLVLGDQYYPGWQATVDGRPAAIWRVNAIFRGVMLGPGRHTVAFAYRPDSLRFGGWISILGMAVLGFLLIFPNVILSAAGERRPRDALPEYRAHSLIP